MSWFVTIIILSFTFTNLSEARHEKKLPSAVVVGTVYCDTCFQEEFSKASHFISGASVAVECRETTSKPSFRQEEKTNENGEFKVHLPFSVGKHVKKIEGCSVKLISSSEPYCAVASTATSSSIHLKSRKQGTHIFSAGFFTFKPLKQPNLCNQKPSFKNSQEFNSIKSLIPFPAPIEDPLTPSLPPMDQDHFPPPPQLPELPPLPQPLPVPPLLGFPNFPPVTEKKTQLKTTNTRRTSQLSDQKVAQPEFFPPIPFLPSPPPIFGIPLPPNPFQPPSIFPPNPFQPPPSIFPPNPLQPPPASIFPPNPFQPPPASIFPPNPFHPSPPPPFFNLPPIPGFTPSPPPPPPPIFPIPLPPFPFPNPFHPSPPPPFLNLPPIPGFTPSPPPSPPPIFPIPFPPFPFQTSPGFPGIPPASSSKKTSP